MIARNHQELTIYNLFKIPLVMLLSVYALGLTACASTSSKSVDDEDVITYSPKSETEDEIVYSPVEDKEQIIQYKLEKEESKHAAYIKFAQVEPPAITSDLGVTYEDVYGSENLVALLVDYEYKAFSRFGKLSLLFGSGFMTASGKGRFARDVGEEAREAYTLYIFPNHASVLYRFQYKEDQFLIPYVFGGAGYFFVVENRDDDKPANYVGAPTGIGGGGILFSFTSLDQQASSEIYNEYGISAAHICLEYRRFQGLNKDIDLTANVFNIGFALDF